VPPSLATIVFAAGIYGLFWLDRDREARTSPALWIPVVWVFIAGSRMVSQWLQLVSGIQSPDQYLDGSPLDRLILTCLLGAGVIVLVARGKQLGSLFAANWPIVLFFSYCATSVLWSDFPGVAFKRWTKALGDFVMVLVVLTEPNTSAALKRLFARTGFLLIPLSVLLVKYYPELGRGYDPWTWQPFYGGVAIGKNGLGYVCLVFGLASLWRFLSTFTDEGDQWKMGSRIAHGVVLAMALWLFWLANSATSLACFLVGGAFLFMMSMRGLARTPAAPHVVIGSVAFLALLVLLLDAGTGLVQAMGRDTTLTGRTQLWDQLGRMVVNPVLGAGFESFWLGERIEKLWRMYWWHPRQAHNGYLEIFLNLGWIGVALIGVMITWGYRNISATFRSDPGAGRLKLAFFVVALIYNVTEAAFKTMNPVGIVFLLAIAVPAFPMRRTNEAL
jgi:exopolysaccharide production protein ExoQ